MPSAPHLSIIIPAYNEAKRISQSLEKLQQFFDDSTWRAEVIVVNDGSSDETVALVESYRSRWSALQLLDNCGNRGKGFSVRNGALRAQGEIILFTDADLSAPITEACKLVDPIANGECDVAFGSRAVDRSLIGVHQSPFRESSGRVFNWLVRCFTGLNFKDTQCGFKAFRRDVTVPVFERQKIMGFGFDPEILFLAKKRGLRLREIPVRWDHAEGTTVRLLRDSCRMFFDLLMIRWNDLLGRYQ